MAKQMKKHTPSDRIKEGSAAANHKMGARPTGTDAATKKGKGFMPKGMDEMSEGMNHETTEPKDNEQE